VIGDPPLLRDVLSNLLGNAWKFSRASEPAIIRFGAQRQDGELVYVVSDNGIGFPAGIASELFMPFKRLHALTFEGAGVGLATVERIIQRHGGRVWAESEPGKGATFYFTIGAPAPSPVQASSPKRVAEYSSWRFPHRPGSTSLRPNGARSSH